MPCPLIEPRLTACHSGNIFVRGDFDQPLPETSPHGTHLRILRASGLEKASHPPAYSSYNPAPPAYPSFDEKAAVMETKEEAPPFPAYNPNQSNFGNAGYQGGPSNDQYGNAGYRGQPGFDPNQQGGYTQTSDGQNAYYPTQKKKKSCCIQ